MQRGTSRDKAEVSFVYLTTHVSLLHSKKTLVMSRTVVYVHLYTRVGLFIGGRQGLHRFTCVKAAWRKTHRKSYIELRIARFCVAFMWMDLKTEFGNETTSDSNVYIICLKASHESIWKCNITASHIWLHSHIKIKDDNWNIHLCDLRIWNLIYNI